MANRASLDSCLRSSEEHGEIVLDIDFLKELEAFTEDCDMKELSFMISLTARLAASKQIREIVWDSSCGDSSFDDHFENLLLVTVEVAKANRAVESATFIFRTIAHLRHFDQFTCVLENLKSFELDLHHDLGDSVAV